MYSVEERLLRHNSGIGGEATKGLQWEVCVVYNGFKDKAKTRCFEPTLQARSNSVKHWSGRHAKAVSARGQKQYQGVHKDPSYKLHTLDDLADDEPLCNKLRSSS